MTQQIIATGSAANDGTGDTLRSAGTKINANFSELYANIYTLPTAQPPANNLGIPVAGRLGGVIPDGNTITITNGVISAVSSAASAGALTGTALKSTVVSSSLTSVGTLTSLTVSGTTTLSTSLNGLLKSTNGLVSSAVAGTDYLVRGSLSVAVASNSGGGNLTYSNGIFTFTPPLIPNYSVTTATPSGDGSLSISGTVFTYTPYSLQPATTATLGGVRVDGSSVTINNGVISVSTGLSGSISFKGTWNASTNTPTLSSNQVGANAGWMYIVGTSGTQNLGAGSFTYQASDLLVYDGVNWIDIASNNGVVSFNSRTGAVLLTSNDVTSALGYTPLRTSDLSSYLTGISQSQVTSALGYTPLQASSLSIVTNAASGSGSLSYSSGVFTFTPYALPTASTAVLGGVKIDNSTITISNGVISVSSALTSATQFKGNWDATNNSPLLGGSLPAGVVAGWEYIVSVAGTRDIVNGSTAYSIGDLVIYDGAKWVRIPGGNAVTSFNTRQGAISLTSSDVTTALGFTPSALIGSSSITTLGTIATGIWNGSVIAGQYGGTGVANTGKTITLGGNLTTAGIFTTSGAFTTTLTATSDTTLTLPTTGTLVTRAGTETLTNKTLGATTIAGSLIPDTDITYDLGSTSYRFRDLYLSGSSIKLGSATITSSGTTLSIPASSTLTTPVIASNITTASTSFDLVNTTATTVNFAGAATVALKIGASGAPITGFAATATSTSTAASLGYLGMPQQSKSGAYTTVIGDAGKHIYVTATATITIDSNANVAYPIGTTIAFIAAAGATVTIAITSDTMYLGGTGTTGSRTLAAYGMATAVKVTSTSWFINGTGLT